MFKLESKILLLCLLHIMVDVMWYIQLIVVLYFLHISECYDITVSISAYFLSYYLAPSLAVFIIVYLLLSISASMTTTRKLHFASLIYSHYLTCSKSS